MTFRGSFVVLGLVRLAIATASAEEAGEMAMVFAEMDRNKDGTLSLDEFAGLSDGDDDGMSKEEVEDAKKEMKVSFDKLDEDKNGKLSQTEMSKEVELDVEEPVPDATESALANEEAGPDDYGKFQQEAGTAALADATGELMNEAAEADATGELMKEAAEADATGEVMEEEAEADATGEVTEEGAEADADMEEEPAPEAHEPALMEEEAEADATGEVMEEEAEGDATTEVMESEDTEVDDMDEEQVGMAEEQVMAGDAETVAHQIVEDLDKDHDGQLSFDEFVAEQVDLYDHEEHEDEVEKKDEKDKMMKQMKKEFEKTDTDGNGKLSLQEVHSLTEGDHEESAEEIERIHKEDEGDEESDADDEPSDEA